MAASNLRPSMHAHARSYSGSTGGGPRSSLLYTTRTRDTVLSETEETPLLEQQSGGPLSRQQTAVKADDNSSWPVRFVKSVGKTTWAILCSNYVNVLLVFVPLGIVSGALGWDHVKTFVFNFLAIIPLAALLAFATEELSAKLGQTIGGLMNATFGNAVELIVSIVALRQGQIRVVQASMLGSILSNLLLVLGCCFIAGGIRFKAQSFNVTIAQTMSSLLAVASVSLIIPATLYATLSNDKNDAEKNVLIVSRGTAVVMLILYILYLLFQLKTHADLFTEENTKSKQKENSDASANNLERGNTNTTALDTIDEGAGEAVTMSPTTAAVVLIIITVCVAVCAEYLVDSIDDLVQRAHISKTFIGLILLPIVGNAAEHVTAVVVSLKNEMNLALSVAIGSSLQIALFVTPFLVLLGWAMGEQMTLHFETFETVVFFLSVFVVNYLIADGESNYLEGCMCIGTYVIIAVAFYVYPEHAKSNISIPSL